MTQLALQDFGILVRSVWDVKGHLKSGTLIQVLANVPFLEHEFGLSFRKLVHLDLRPWLRKLGFTGGLKKIQQRFSEIPRRNAMDIDGYDAVILWHWAQLGMPGALETLYTYNAEDTWVLEPLLIHAYNLETIHNSFLQLEPLSLRPAPAWKTKVSGDVYEQLSYRKQNALGLS